MAQSPPPSPLLGITPPDPRYNSVIMHEDQKQRKVAELRTALIAIEKAMGRPVAEIAQKYKVSTDNVKKHLDLAVESGFIDHYRALLYDQLAPKVIAVYEAHLTMGSLEAARDLAFGLGILQKTTPEVTKLKGRIVDSLDAYRAERAKRIAPSRPTGEDGHAEIVQ